MTSLSDIAVVAAPCARQAVGTDPINWYSYVRMWKAAGFPKQQRTLKQECVPQKIFFFHNFLTKHTLIQIIVADKQFKCENILVYCLHAVDKCYIGNMKHFFFITTKSCDAV